MDLNSWSFMNLYLKNREQVTKIESCCIAFSDIIASVPQGRNLGLLFNVYVGFLYFHKNDLDLASFSNENTPYTCSPELQELKKAPGWNCTQF